MMLPHFHAALAEMQADLEKRLEELDRRATSTLTPDNLAKYRDFCKRMDDWQRDHPDELRLPNNFE